MELSGQLHAGTYADSKKLRDAILSARDTVTMKFGSARNGKPFVVDNKIKSRHTANAVLKQAGLPKGF